MCFDMHKLRGVDLLPGQNELTIRILHFIVSHVITINTTSSLTEKFPRTSYNVSVTYIHVCVTCTVKLFTVDTIGAAGTVLISEVHYI